MPGDHAVTCDCGARFASVDALAEHLAVEAVLAEVERIAGERFATKLRVFEENAHTAGDLSELAASLDVALVPANATELATEAVVQLVRNHEAYFPEKAGEAGG